uniref:Uncharacterized protein n=1 Tax=Glossina pallidipes TaxID=7398 RepID=A0A1A9ZCN3_GLOPL
MCDDRADTKKRYSRRTNNTDVSSSVLQVLAACTSGKLTNITRVQPHSLCTHDQTVQNHHNSRKRPNPLNNSPLNNSPPIHANLNNSPNNIPREQHIIKSLIKSKRINLQHQQIKMKNSHKYCT